MNSSDFSRPICVWQESGPSSNRPIPQTCGSTRPGSFTANLCWFRSSHESHSSTSAAVHSSTTFEMFGDSAKEWCIWGCIWNCIAQFTLLWLNQREKRSTTDQTCAFQWFRVPVTVWLAVEGAMFFGEYGFVGIRRWIRLTSTFRVYIGPQYVGPHLSGRYWWDSQQRFGQSFFITPSSTTF